MIKIYHNPRCKKSRAGLAYLRERTTNFEVVEYLKNPLTEKEIKHLFDKIDLPVEALIRKQEKIFKENFKNKDMTDMQWISAIAQYPKLLQRPIVETEDNAVLADPPDKMNVLF